jgi:peptidoglycan/xylan/chitin deacetylase (PgdA/CDA1 family)
MFVAGGGHHLARWFNRRRLLVVAYHGVANTPIPADLPEWHLLPVRELERQLRYLSRYYRVMPIDRAVEDLRRRHIDRPTACVTFDDGYRNNFTVVLPVLKRLGLPATVYLATGLVGTEDRPWSVRLHTAFRRSRGSRVDLSLLGLGYATLDGPAQRAGLAFRVVDALKALQPRARDRHVQFLLTELGVVDLDDMGHFAMMSWDEAREMERSGLVTFGAHTVHHEILSRLADGELEHEISHSVATLTRNVCRPSRTFAYPNGRHVDFDSRAKAVLRANGVTAALATVEGLNSPIVDPHELRRISIAGTMRMDQFCMATSGLSTLVKGWLRRA